MDDEMASSQAVPRPQTNGARSQASLDLDVSRAKVKAVLDGWESTCNASDMSAMWQSVMTSPSCTAQTSPSI